MTKAARIYRGGRTVSSISNAGENWMFMRVRMNMYLSLTSYIKINSKWIRWGVTINRKSFILGDDENVLELAVMAVYIVYIVNILKLMNFIL